MANDFASLSREVGRWLNDLEDGFPHIRWTQQDLIEYANDAVLQISNVRPDLFVSTKEITLVAGALQALGDGCERLVDVIGTMASNGVLVASRPSKTDDMLDKWFANEPHCGSNGVLGAGAAYALASYSLLADQKSFIVSPPVPSTPPVKIKVQCFSTPKPGAASDGVPLDARWHNAIIEWMRYRALSIEEESASSFSKAQFHLQHFYQMLGLSKQAMDALIGSKAVNVQTSFAPAQSG